jgi:divalent metal cation (Fe/Co/Zn/Cd) transporter
VSEAPDRVHARRAAIQLSLATVAWNTVAGVTAIITAIQIGSLALIGFGLEAAIDAAASGLLTWRFHIEARSPERAERLEDFAQRAIGAAFIVAGLYVGYHSVSTLVAGNHPSTSTFAIAQSVASLLVLPILAWRKRRLSTDLGSRALRSDSTLTGAAAGLAFVTLLGLSADQTLGWWWADASAAILIAAFLLREGVYVLHQAPAAASLSPADLTAETAKE